MADGEQQKSRRERAEEIKEAGVPDEAAVAAGLPTAAETRAAERAGEADETFTVERLLGDQGVRIAEASVRKLDHVDRHALAGAFMGLEPDEELTREQVRERVEGFYAHADTTGQEE